MNQSSGTHVIKHFGSHSLEDFPEYQQQRMPQYSTLSREFVFETINIYSTPLTPDDWSRFYSPVDNYCSPMLGPHLNVIRNIVVGYVLTFKEQAFPGDLVFRPDSDTSLDAMAFAIYSSLSIRYAWMETGLRKYPASHARRLLEKHMPSKLHKFLVAKKESREIIRRVIHPLMDPSVLTLMNRFNESIGLQNLIIQWDSVIERKSVPTDPALC